MVKHYRVKKDTFMWKEGAIIMSNGDGYRPIEDIWNAVPLGSEYISDHIIEHPDNSDFFEKVYPDTVTGNLYRTKEQMLNLYKTAFKS